jgi:hypothetical protein
MLAGVEVQVRSAKIHPAEISGINRGFSPIFTDLVI